MADAPDPNTAPAHLEVRDTFAPIHVAICAVLGVGAAVVGLILGIVLVND